MKFERPLRTLELDILEERLTRYRSRSKRRLWSVITCTILASTAVSYFQRTQDTRGAVPAVIIFIAFFFLVIVQYRNDKRKRKSIAYLKDKNSVTVIAVNSDICCVLKEYKKEGTHYLYQLDDNKVLSFGGPDFYEDDDFPNDKFEILEGRGIRNEIVLFETIVYGNRIQPRAVINGQEKRSLLASPHYPDPKKLTIANGKIEDFVNVRKDSVSQPTT